ncbi:hypothetical protein PBI_GAIA_48 [Mycobacterium phage Gaia]|uniref:Uncharacterized protein n=1 Tax=Mycobacterium phage Gaia TaxID=1486472 RepID=A0A068F3F2_9CAUD|nr:hypothetical protein VC46_gp048 [Mycobacterium phage Gaia]AID58868.1 hypothetical protein PBI_GAIA_48 [Mycobacterium phage Gaia]AYQ99993.1 hypothetical protein PBI_NEBKISS_52 [Mycobacterium phage Nebkiss]
MSDYVIGALAAAGIWLAVSLVLAASAWLLRFTFEHGDGMFKLRRRNAHLDLNRASMAAMVYTGWSVRPLWLAGFGVIIYRQPPDHALYGETEYANVRQAILAAAERGDR